MKWSKEFRSYAFTGMTDPEIAKTQAVTLALEAAVAEAANNGDHTFDGDAQSYQNISENAGIELSERRRALSIVKQFTSWAYEIILGVRPKGANSMRNILRSFSFAYAFCIFPLFSLERRDACGVFLREEMGLCQVWVISMKGEVVWRE